MLCFFTLSRSTRTSSKAYVSEEYSLQAWIRVTFVTTHINSKAQKVNTTLCDFGP